MLASDFLEVSSYSSHDLLEPGPELVAGEADLLTEQLVEYNGNVVLQFGQGVVGTPITVPFNFAHKVKVVEIAVMGIHGKNREPGNQVPSKQQNLQQTLSKI